MALRITILFYWLLIASTSAVAEAHLPYFTAHYSASIKGIPVTAKREFTAISNNVGELRFSADSWIASLQENAKFIWDKQQIKPLRFSHEREILGKQELKRLTFDWGNNTITSIEKDRSYIIRDTDKAMDHLSFQLQLQYDLLMGQTGKIYRVADKKNIKEYRFEIMEEQIIETNLGKLNTVKVKVIRDSNDRLTYLWFAKDWHYLLAKMEQYEDGDMEFELQLAQATVAQQTVTGL